MINQTEFHEFLMGVLSPLAAYDIGRSAAHDDGRFFRSIKYLRVLTTYEKEDAEEFSSLEPHMLTWAMFQRVSPELGLSGNHYARHLNCFTVDKGYWRSLYLNGKG